MLPDVIPYNRTKVQIIDEYQLLQFCSSTLNYGPSGSPKKFKVFPLAGETAHTTVDYA